MEILILHPGGLGDTILSLPAIALIRDCYPSARITMAGNIDHLAAIMSSCVERIVSLSSIPLHRLYVRGRLPEADVRFWKSFDWIVSWTGSGDPEFERRFRKVHPGVCIASWRPSLGEERHVSQLFVDSLNLNAPPEMKPTPTRIPLNSGLCREGTQWLIERGWNGQDPLVTLHPGAGSNAKRWPISRFIELARYLTVHEQRTLLIIEGPAEPELAKQIVQALPETNAIQVRSVPLNLLAAVIQQSGVFIGNDSGIAHLAAALHVPAIVLFGPTLPQHWAPLGKHVAVLRNPRGCEGCASGRIDHTCLHNIAVHEVIQKLSSNFESRNEI